MSDVSVFLKITNDENALNWVASRLAPRVVIPAVPPFCRSQPHVSCVCNADATVNRRSRHSTMQGEHQKYLGEGRHGAAVHSDGCAQCCPLLSRHWPPPLCDGAVTAGRAASTMTMSAIDPSRPGFVNRQEERPDLTGNDGLDCRCRHQQLPTASSTSSSLSHRLPPPSSSFSTPPGPQETDRMLDDQN